MWKLRLLVRIFFTYGKRKFTFTCFFWVSSDIFQSTVQKKHDWKIHKSSQHPKTPKKNTGHWSSTRTSHDGHDPMFCRRGPWVFSNAQQTSGAPQSWELEKKWVGVVGWKKLIIEFFFLFLVVIDGVLCPFCFFFRCSRCSCSCCYSCCRCPCPSSCSISFLMMLTATATTTSFQQLVPLVFFSSFRKFTEFLNGNNILGVCWLKICSLRHLMTTTSLGGLRCRWVIKGFDRLQHPLESDIARSI